VRWIPGGGAGGGPGAGAGAALVVVVEREKQPEQTVAPAKTIPRAKNFIMQVPDGRSAWLVASLYNLALSRSMGHFLARSR